METRNVRGEDGPRRRRFSALVAASLVFFAMFPSTALADHGDASVIIVGLDDRGRQAEELHEQDVTVNAGTILSFFFDNDTHNITSFAQPAGTISLTSPGAPGSESVGSTHAYAFAAPGEYLDYCSIHEDDPAGRFDNGQPQSGKMVGRVTVLPDSTPPVWDPGSASATPLSDSQISLTWPPATDDSGSVSYEIYEAVGATRPTKPATPAATVTGTAASRTGLTPSTHYWYWITAVDGAGNPATPDQLTDATTLAAGGGSLSLTLSLPTMDFATVIPGSPAVAGLTATVTSDAVWTMSVKSIGRDGVDDAPGDDGLFTSDGGSGIPVSRLTWDAGSGPVPLSDVDAAILENQPATPAAGTALLIDFSLLLQFGDPDGTGYRTTLLYTVVQP